MKVSIEIGITQVVISGQAAQALQVAAEAWLRNPANCRTHPALAEGLEIALRSIDQGRQEQAKRAQAAIAKMFPGSIPDLELEAIANL